MRTDTLNIAFSVFFYHCANSLHTNTITCAWFSTHGEWETGQRAPHQFFPFYFAFPPVKRNARRHLLCRTLSSTSFSSLLSIPLLAIHHHNHIESKLNQNIASLLHLANRFLIGSSTAAALAVILSMLPFSCVVNIVVVVLVHRLSVVASHCFRYE